MSQMRGQTVLSFQADETVTAGLVVYKTANANAVARWLTQTANILGVSADASGSQTGAGLPVVIAGTAKCVCFASVSVGAIVGPATDSSRITERANGATQTAKSLGIALESGSTDSSIEVMLQVDNKAQA